MFSTDDMTEFHRLLPDLAPGGDAKAAIAFAAERPWAEELGTLPGDDRVRAGLLRLLPALTSEPASALEAATAAFAAYEPEALGGAEQLRRHPAWVALARLELGERQDEAWAEGRDAALALARRGYAALPGAVPTADGELLWAIAEMADEVGWIDRARPLLVEAEGAAWADLENRARVRLLLLIAAAEAGEAEARSRAEALAADEDADDPTIVSALWIAAALDVADEAPARAVQRLRSALERVDREEDPEVAERIEARIAALQSAGPAGEA